MGHQCLEHLEAINVGPAGQPTSSPSYGQVENAALSWIGWKGFP